MNEIVRWPSLVILTFSGHAYAAPKLAKEEVQPGLCHHILTQRATAMIAAAVDRINL